ncbi:MAG: sigma-70 family RNA polymerase sigma factor [Opitutaceae bacterium]|nr:sigma-70 family RNA polymerase sigma factor [Opitutaceae bacterium]
MELIKAVGRLLVASPERKAEADVDALVVQEVRAGNVAAFDQLVRKYRERIYSIVYNLTSNREDAADLTQDAFIKAFQSIHRFGGQSSFFTWLYRIAVNTAHTHLRKNRLRTFFSIEQASEEEKTPEWLAQLAVEAGAEKEIYSRDLQQRLNEAFQKLSIKHRTVITLFEIDGLSHAEIADVMDSTEGTVRSRLHYAKLQLQADLQDLLKR